MKWRVHFIYGDGRPAFSGSAVGRRDDLADAAYDDGAVGVTVMELI